MGINKVVYGNTTLIDLTDSNLDSASQLPTGVNAYSRSGVLLQGNATYMSLVSSPTAGDVLVTDSNGQAVDSGIALSSKQNSVLSGTNEPSSSLGVNGDIYILYSE